MTWKEFKERVDKLLAEKGKDENIDVFAIDFGYDPEFEIQIENDMLCIW